MHHPETEIVLVDSADDTDENRDVISVAEERSAAPRSHDRDLDELIEAFSYAGPASVTD